LGFRERWGEVWGTWSNKETLRFVMPNLFRHLRARIKARQAETMRCWNRPWNKPRNRPWSRPWNRPWNKFRAVSKKPTPIQGGVEKTDTDSGQQRRNRCRFSMTRERHLSV
jgi:hypothetical protein